MTSFSKGATSQTIDVYLKDVSSTSGDMPLTGLEYNSAGLSIYYIRQGETQFTDISPTSSGTPGTYTASGFCEISDYTRLDGAPGVYQYGLPDEVLEDSATVDYATLVINGATNLEQYVEKLELLDTITIGSDNKMYLSNTTGTIPVVPSNELADFIIRRNISGVRESTTEDLDDIVPHSLLGAIARLTNKVERVEELLLIKIYEEDGTTPSHSGSIVVEAAGLDPLVSYTPIA